MRCEIKMRDNIFCGVDYGTTFIFDRAVCIISIDKRYKRLEIFINKKEKTNRKKININEMLECVINYINNNHNYIKKDDFEFEDVLKCSNVVCIHLNDLKIENKDIELIKRKFTNLRMIQTGKCTYYRNCNIGMLNCDIMDNNSDIYDFGMFNGYNGRYLELRKSNVKRMNHNVLHLNSEILNLSGVNLDYEKFFLTTDAPKLRKLCIYRYPHYKILNDLDLLFISGFYNLESIDINGLITNYSQIEKLEKLRKIERLYITEDLDIVKEKYRDRKIYKEILKSNDKERLNNFLLVNRMQIQNIYHELFHKLYVPRLDSVVWKDKITTKELKEIKKELLMIEQMNSFDRNKISREILEHNVLDEMDDLNFDYHREEEEEYLTNSRPFSDEGIDYYVKRKKIILDEWGSTYGNYLKYHK